MYITLQSQKELTMISNVSSLSCTWCTRGTNRLQLSCNHFIIGYSTIKQLATWPSNRPIKIQGHMLQMMRTIHLAVQNTPLVQLYQEL